jgi:hypothetical protein
VNAFLNGLNELRRCLLPGIFPKLRESLVAALTEVDTILQANERAVLTPGLRGDATELRELAKEMKEVMKTIVTPYLKGALESSLGNEEGAKEFNEQVISKTEAKMASTEEGDEKEEVEENDDNAEEVEKEEEGKIESEEGIAETQEKDPATEGWGEEEDAILLEDEELQG